MRSTHCTLARLAVPATIAAAALCAVGSGPLAHAAPIGAALAQQRPSPCVVNYAKTAAPSSVPLGAAVDIVLTADVTCPGAPPELHLVLVLDGSGSMQGSPAIALKQAAKRLVYGLDLPGNPSTQVGVVEFNTAARRLSLLSNSERQVIGACEVRAGVSHGHFESRSAIVHGIRLPP